MSVKTAFLHLTRAWLRGGRWVAVFVGLGCFAWAYVHAFQRHNAATGVVLDEQERLCLDAAIATRHDLTPDFTKGVSKPLNDWLPHRTDGVVRPLWPWLAAWQIDLAHPPAGGTLSDDDVRVVRAGKRWLAGLSLGFLLMLGLAAARAFSVPAALLTVVLSGFSVLLPAASTFAPDALFQMLFLLTWVCCVAALKRNSLWLYGMIGFFSALANLTLPTTTTLVVVFLAVSTLRWLWGWILAHWPHEGGTSLWVWRNHWLGLLLLVVCHLITAGPMLSHAHEELGRASPFFWRWFDDAEEMRQWTAAHQTRESYNSATLPGYAQYVADHTPEAIRERLLSGSASAVKSVMQWPLRSPFPPQERGIYVAALAGALLLLLIFVAFVAPRAHHAGQALHPETAPLVLFTVLAFAACLFDFGWDAPVLVWGSRTLALYPPLVLSLLWACEALVQRARRREMRLPVFFLYEAVLWILCGLAAWQVIAILQPVSFAA